MPNETPKARAAWELYRDLGPSRTLREVAELLGHPPSYRRQLVRWSTTHGWVARATAHDHRTIRDGLGQRAIYREHGIQRLAEHVSAAVDQVIGTIHDDRDLPILDRQGDEVGRKPLVPASTKLEAAKLLLGICGIVPTKRLELTDKTEDLDEQVDTALEDMDDKDLAALEELLSADADDQ